MIKFVRIMHTVVLMYTFDAVDDPNSSHKPSCSRSTSFSHTISPPSTSPDIFFGIKFPKYYHIAIHLYHFSFRFAGRHSLGLSGCCHHHQYNINTRISIEHSEYLPLAPGNMCCAPSFRNPDFRPLCSRLELDRCSGHSVLPR